jgi:hypothetical protein
MPRILGREPALWLALVAAVVKLVSAFWIKLSIDQQSLINALAAAIVGLIVAAIVRDGLSAALLGLAQSGLALAVGFGLHMAADQQATLMAAVGIVIAMFVRTQVTAPVSAAPVLAAVKDPAVPGNWEA